MTNKVDLPSEYKPFKKLTICSNILENGLVPIIISGDVPFLIGKGKKPRVWINMLSQTTSGVTKAIVRDNLSLHNQVSVKDSENMVSVYVNNETLIEVIKHNDNEAEIIKLNLKMIGIDISGDKNALKVVTQTMSHNSFVNVDCMIGIDT